MKKSFFLWMGALMLMLSSCSTNDNITESISLSKVSHSECENHSRTRGEDENPFASKLKLTYNEADQTITGEYINYMLSCDYTDAGINIEQDTDGTLVLNSWNKAENMVDCVCHINIYFTIRNATMQNYHLVLNRRTVTVADPDGSKHQETWTDYDGYISFKNQNIIIINLSSDDDDYSYVQEFSNKNDIENFIGTWHILHRSYGWGINEDYEAGEVTVTFTKNGEMQVVNKREDQRPFPTGTLTYSFVDIEKSIFTGEPRTCISFGFLLCSYSFDKGYLHLSEEAYDGPGYTLQKLK